MEDRSPRPTRVVIVVARPHDAGPQPLRRGEGGTRDGGRGQGTSRRRIVGAV